MFQHKHQYAPADVTQKEAGISLHSDWRISQKDHSGSARRSKTTYADSMSGYGVSPMLNILWV